MKKTAILAVALAVGISPGFSAPATLIELGGGRLSPSGLSESVVLIIDAQREYTEGRIPLANVTGALHQTQRLLQRARLAGVPIIHIQQRGKPGRGLFDPEGKYFAFAPEAMPLAGETVITKSLPNAFAGTNLDTVVKATGRGKIIISGYMTHMCVSATARAALDLGYKTTVIADACATRDLPANDGTVIDAATVHRVTLAELGDRFSSIVETLDQIPD